MFLLDETGRFLYTKYGKSEEGVQTLGEKIIHGIHRFLEILEIVLAAIIVLVLVALMGIEIWELARDPSVFLAEGFLDSFLSSITSLTKRSVKIRRPTRSVHLPAKSKSTPLNWRRLLLNGNSPKTMSLIRYQSIPLVSKTMTIRLPANIRYN